MPNLMSANIIWLIADVVADYVDGAEHLGYLPCGIVKTHNSATGQVEARLKFNIRTPLPYLSPTLGYLLRNVDAIRGWFIEPNWRQNILACFPG